MIGRGLVPRIRSRHEIRNVRSEDVDGTRCPSARRREVVGRRDLAAVQHDFAGRLRDRLGRRCSLARDAEIDLAAHIRVEVEGLALHQVCQRIRARCHGLRLQNLSRPAVRHLTCDDALEVALERRDVHDTQEPALDDELELAPVGAPVEGEECLLGGSDDEWRDCFQRTCLGRQLEVGSDRQRSLRELEGRARRIDGGVRQGRRDRQCPTALGEKHAHLFPAGLSDLRPRVVVAEDLVVRPSRQRLSVRAVLAHPDAVAVSAPRDDEGRFAVRRSRDLLTRSRSGGEGENDGECSEKWAHEKIQGSSAGL